MHASTRAALRAVSLRLTRHRIDFALGGSGLLWALGLADEVRDLDLMCDADDERRFLAATEDWLRAHTHAGTDLWASAWFAQLDVCGVDVDAIGGMAFRHPGGVARVPVRISGHVDVDGASVPYADPALWWAVYAAYKPEKAALLEQVVDAPQRSAVASELGLARA